MGTGMILDSVCCNFCTYPYLSQISYATWHFPLSPKRPFPFLYINIYIPDIFKKNNCYFWLSPIIIWYLKEFSKTNLWFIYSCEQHVILLKLNNKLLWIILNKNTDIICFLKAVGSWTHKNCWKIKINISQY